MSKLTQIADRRAAENLGDARVFDALRTALLGSRPLPTYETDSKGRKVRVFTREFPCTREDVRELMVNNRVVDEDECLEIVGKNTFRYMVSNGSIVKVPGRPYYRITRGTALYYDLPFYMGDATYTD